ncbi:hypothetical protein B4N89_46795 [Embleya scabrispora]|uniref:Uncharacterized protein n=1 Tax=Embleya scabrispora TaxID=159449 RepID=A0A1T3NI25_9ACTN|nr:hypothetical protein B4N89_46795 [Embleya scabrispora]
MRPAGRGGDQDGEGGTDPTNSPLHGIRGGAGVRVGCVVEQACGCGGGPGIGDGVGQVVAGGGQREEVLGEAVGIQRFQDGPGVRVGGRIRDGVVGQGAVDGLARAGADRDERGVAGVVLDHAGQRGGVDGAGEGLGGDGHAPVLVEGLPVVAFAVQEVAGDPPWRVEVGGSAGAVGVDGGQGGHVHGRHLPEPLWIPQRGGRGDPVRIGHVQGGGEPIPGRREQRIGVSALVLGKAEAAPRRRCPRRAGPGDAPGSATTTRPDAPPAAPAPDAPARRRGQAA